MAIRVHLDIPLWFDSAIYPFLFVLPAKNCTNNGLLAQPPYAFTIVYGENWYCEKTFTLTWFLYKDENLFVVIRF